MAAVESGQTRLRGLLINLSVSIVAIVLALVALEVGLRLVRTLLRPNSQQAPLHILCDDCPFLYRLNPEHPEISSQGMRDREYAVPKPEHALRILALGDSVAYGPFVSPDDTFANRLEAGLLERYGQVDVINAGVSGYTPYNELHYYLSGLSAFQSDVVVVAFAMNDVADPEMHWNYTKEAISEIPIEAIPNLEYHRNHILPALGARQGSSPLTRSEQLDLIRSRLHGDSAASDEARYSYENGQRWPTYITGEDTISIKVLLDYDSREWQWLRSMYDQLNSAVTSDGATLVILLLPLAYQLEEDYPYMPQDLLRRYCEDSSILCLDVLPRFREQGSEKLFLGTRSGYDDIWHLTERGHQLVAEELEAFLVKHDLLRLR